MSGIAGVFHLCGRPVDRSELDRMANALAHRGPDGTSTWGEGALGLVHLALNVTPESRYESGVLLAGELALVADVRLDNREHLLDSLGLRSSAGRPITDPLLILAAYERWGEQCVEHLLGAFAFAVWDGRERRLFIARDHFGVKPLAYAYEPGRFFAFASEPKALLELEGVSEVLDDLAVAQHLLIPVREDMARTFFRDIRSLAPAHTASVEEAKIRIHQYWSLDLEREVRLGSDEAYAETFREIFQEAVRCCLRSEAPVGAMVSGGMDSSSIVSTASRMGWSTPAYSAVYPEVPASDESEFIDAVVEKYDLSSYRFQATDVSPLGPIGPMQRHLDSPVAAGNLYINWHLYRAAAAAGSKAILDGFDGDTTVSHGVGYFNELRSQGRYVSLAREVKAYAEAIGEPWRPTVWSWLRGPVLRMTGGGAVRRSVRGAIRLARTGAVRVEPPPPTWERILNSEFAARVRGDLCPPSAKPQREREHHLHILSRSGLIDFNRILDATAAAAGVEVRLPFFDRRLVEFCLALPPDQKLRRGQSRFVLRQAMAGTLPEKVRLRGGKTSIGHAFDRGLRHFEQERIRGLCDGVGDRTGEYVNRDVLQTYGMQFLSGTAGPNVGLAFWRGLSLDLWLSGLERARSDRLIPDGTSSLRGAAPFRVPLGKVV